MIFKKTKRTSRLRFLTHHYSLHLHLVPLLLLPLSMLLSPNPFLFGNPPCDIAANAAAVTRSSHVRFSITPTIQSREPAGSIAGSIEDQVKRQNQQLDATIQEIRPHRPDPVIATEESVISAMTIHSSPFLPSLDMALPTE